MRSSLRTRFAAHGSRLRWTAGALLLGAATVAFTPARALFTPGITYTFSMTTAESDASFADAGKTIARQVGKVQVAGDRARIEFAEVKGGTPAPMMAKDGYMLVHEGGNVLYMVDPGEKQYLKVEPKALGSMLSTMSNMAGGMMKIEVKDASMSVRNAGPGESMLGHATEKWEVEQSYTMSIRTFGFGSTTTNEATTTLWLAKSLSPGEMLNPFLDMARNLSSMFEGNEEWEKVAMGPARELPQAAALKMRSTQKTTSDKGKTQYSVSTMEVTDWKKGDVPAGALELPKGYKLVEMPNMAALSDSMRAAGLDSLDLKESMRNAGYSDEDIAAALKQAALDGAFDQAKLEAREAGKNAVKAGIGGLLRRKKPF